MLAQVHIALFTGILPLHFAGGMVHGNGLILKVNRTVGGLIHAGNAVEGGGFAGTVGTDECYDFALVGFHGKVIDGNHAAELHGDVFYTQHAAHAFVTSCFALRLGIFRFQSSLSPIKP